MTILNARELVLTLPRNTRSHLYEELIEIILDSKKDTYSNELVSNILGFWQKDQLISLENTISLVKTSYDLNHDATLSLLNRLGLSSLSEFFEDSNDNDGR